jgi:glycerophosphoryl diester phosphodiesterase
VEIIAHRGASYDAPENTLSAVELAWRQHADAVEIDVHCSRDGKIVAIHDPTLRKLACCPGNVCDKTLAELRRLDVGLWKHKRWRGERIPTLDEILRTIPSGKRLFIEVKCGVEALLELGSALRRTKTAAKSVALIGFSLATMMEAKRLLPKLEVSWIVERKRDWRTEGWTPAAEFLIERVRQAGLDGLDMGVRGLHTKFVKEVKAAHLKCYVWTVDTPAVARRLIAAGIDGITTNRPAWLREQLK